LSAVETLQEYRSLLKGGVVRLHTDHRNLTYKNLSSDRCLHWRLLLEEFDVTFIYKPGETNIHADFLSRHPSISEAELPTWTKETSPNADLSVSESLLYESLVNVPAGGQFPLNLPDIANHQTNDQRAQDYLRDEPDKFEMHNHGGSNLISRRASDGSWKIVLPEAVVDEVIEWYHSITSHGGQTRTRQSIETFFYYPNLRDKIKEHIDACDSCQRNKDSGKIQGHAPPRDETAVPFSDVAVDLVGPWKVMVNGRIIEIFALSSICVASSLFELIRVDEKSSQHVWQKFVNSWLARYPRPLRVIFDQGGEFIGREFISGLIQLGIQPVSITSKNPQANAVCERSHRTVKNQLRAMMHNNEVNDIGDALDYIDTAFASCMFASRTAVHRGLGYSPGGLIFQRDMLLPLPILADFELVRQRRQQLIDLNAERENARRSFRDYSPGDEVLVKVPRPNAMDARATGPFVVVQSHVNGTVTIQRTPNVFERINIRRIRPYHRG